MRTADGRCSGRGCRRIRWCAIRAAVPARRWWARMRRACASWARKRRKSGLRRCAQPSSACGAGGWRRGAGYCRALKDAGGRLQARVRAGACGRRTSCHGGAAEHGQGDRIAGRVPGGRARGEVAEALRHRGDRRAFGRGSGTMGRLAQRRKPLGRPRRAAGLDIRCHRSITDSSGGDAGSRIGGGTVERTGRHPNCGWRIPILLTMRRGGGREWDAASPPPCGRGHRRRSGGRRTRAFLCRAAGVRNVRQRKRAASARAEGPWNTWVRTRSAPRIRIVTRLRPAQPVCGWTRRAAPVWIVAGDCDAARLVVVAHGRLLVLEVVVFGNRVSDSGRCRIDALDDVVFRFGLASSFRRRAAGRVCSRGRAAGCSSSSQPAGLALGRLRTRGLPA